MARIDWVTVRLNNWALWKVRERSGGMGFATQAAFLNDAAGETRPEARIPVDEIEAAITDQAVESLKAPRPHLYRALQCVYPLGMGVKAAARECNCATSTIYSLLNVADGVLAEWFRERAEKARQAQSAYIQRTHTIRQAPPNG